MSTTDRQLTQRNGSLPDLVALLREQHAAKLDIVIPAAGIRSSGGRWQIDGTGTAVLGPDGVTTSPGTFVPTDTCDSGMADKLGIPLAYLRRLRAEHVVLYDPNVNGWLEQQRWDRPGGAVGAVPVRGQPRRAAGGPGWEPQRRRGCVEVRRCDLTERRMYVQIASQSVAAQADRLLRDYVSPFTGARGADNPLVFAGSCCRTRRPGTGRSRLRRG